MSQAFFDAMTSKIICTTVDEVRTIDYGQKYADVYVNVLNVNRKEYVEVV